MVYLPKSVSDAFNKLASNQRGDPEFIMTRIQHDCGGGVLNPVIEHTGDLTHRMSEHSDFPSYSGHEYIQEKVERCLKYLKYKYGFSREMHENFTANAPLKGRTAKEQEEKIKGMCLKYAEAHAALKVYNRTQWWAREAAIAVGKWDWDKVIYYLEKLETLCKDRNLYEKEMREYKLDSNGNPLVFPYKEE